jgi:RND family efflux transporter MFP subunit
MKRILIISAISIGLVALIVVKLLSNKEKVAGKIYIHDTSAPILVEDTIPGMHTFDNALSFMGTFEPIRQNSIGSDASGKIVQISVKEGDYVTAGQVLAKVDNEYLLLQLQSLEVTIEGQKKDDERFTSLSASQAIPEVQAEKNKLALESLEIQKKQLQKQINSATIKAPFSGVITKKFIDLGSIVGPGVPLFEITDVSSLKLTVYVPEAEIMKFSKSQKVTVTADIYTGRNFEGTISNIAVQADKSHNFEVEVTVSNPNKDLMAGMYGNMSVTNQESKNALAIPRAALIGSTQNPQVYIIKNGKAMLTSFQAGISDGTHIEVANGIDKNDRIVTKGQVNLQNNSNVKTK